MKLGKSPYFCGSWVRKKQRPFPNKKEKKAKTIYYGIIEDLKVRLSAQDLFRFYQQRQTIENFFKESKNPFNSGKMPSQRFKANEAYLQFVAIAYNSYSWFKKTFSISLASSHYGNHKS